MRTRAGLHGSASFFGPYNRAQEPYIRIATGDYLRLRKARGRDNALAAYICSLSHEVIHYQQWLAGVAFDERAASRGASRWLRRYSATVEHP